MEYIERGRDPPRELPQEKDTLDFLRLVKKEVYGLKRTPRFPGQETHVLRTFIVAIVSLLIISSAFVLLTDTFNLNLTGRSTFTQEAVTYQDNLNLDINSNQKYNWIPENYGKLTGLGVSGRLIIQEGGYARVYLGDRLIFDSSKTENLESVSSGTSSLMPITGRVIEEVGQENTSGIIPSEIGNITNTTNATDTAENVTIPLPLPSLSENTTPIGNLSENLSGEVIEDQTLNQTSNQTQEEPEKQVNILEFDFSGVCIDTCDLSGINLTDESYNLRFEVENARIVVKGIDYEILPVQIAENISQENITLANFTENITQYAAVIGQPVKWSKRIFISDSDKAKEIKIDVPLEADKVKINGEDTKAEKKGKKSEILFNATLNEYEITYETSAPEISKKEISQNRKEIIVTGPDSVHYQNVLASTDIQEAPKERIKLYWLVNGTRQLVENITYFDENNNGLIERIEWIVPSLSEQRYEIVIEITKAEHLDENRDFISDIYEKVYQLDNVWSEEISQEHYVRVVFEKNLTNENDITLYPRIVSGNPRIEVYEVNGTKLIAEFTSLQENEYNKVFLTNLEGEQDTFDLKIVGGSIEFDHIIDPITDEFYDDFESGLGKWDGNGATNWGTSGTRYISPSTSLYSTNGREGNIFSDDIDTSAATFINATFWFYPTAAVDSGDYDFYFCYGSGTCTLMGNFGALANDAWVLVEYTTSNSNFFRSDFYIRMNANVGTGETAWIDNFLVQITTPDLGVTADFGTNPVEEYNDGDGSITFDMKCTQGNNPISMIQLWTNTTGTWKANYSNSSYSSGDWLNITVAGIPNGQNYKWAVWCNDTSSLDDWTDTNRTFIVDSTPRLNVQYVELDKSSDSWFGDIIFNATVINQLDQPVTGASVNLTVTPPAGRDVDARMVEMKDDGEYPDLSADDGVYTVKFDISLNGSAETTGSHTTNIAASKVGYVEAYNSSQSFTTFALRRWWGSAGIQDAYANYKIQDVGGGIWNIEITDFKVYSPNTAVTNATVKIPIINQPSISGLEVQAGSNPGYHLENNNVIVLYMAFSSGGTTQANFSFNASSDLVLTHNDRYQTQTIGLREGKNGFTIFNSHIQQEIFGNANSNSAENGETTQGPHAPGENVGMKVVDGESHDNRSHTDDCMERVGIPNNRSTGTKQYDICGNCGSYYEWNIHWETPTWNDSYKYMGAEIVAANSTNILLRMKDSQTTNEWGSTNYFNVTKTLEYYSDKRYYKTNFTIENIDTQTINTTLVWGREPWTYSGGATDQNDVGMLAGRYPLTTEEDYTFEELESNWCGFYDQVTNYGTVIIFPTNTTEDVATICAHLDADHTPLGTSSGQNDWPFQTDHQVFSNGYADDIFAAWEIGDFAPGASRSIAFYHWGGYNNAAAGLEGEIVADALEIHNLNSGAEGDTTNPIAVQGTSPPDDYDSSSDSITFDMKCSDNSAVSMIQLWTNTTGTWHANYTNDSYTNDTWLNITVAGIPNGQNYKWAVWCNNTVGFTNMTENRTFSVNTLTDCATLSKANTAYGLLNDVFKSSGACFTINADNITLDCNGHNITGTATYGVYSNPTSGLTVKNCNANVAFYGLYLKGNNTRVINSSFGGNWYGALVGNGINASVINSTSYNNVYRGFYIQGLNDSIFINNTGTDDGLNTFYLVFSKNVTFLNNTVTGRGFWIQANGFLPGAQYYQHSINSSNIINGKPARYYNDIDLACPNNTVLNLGSDYSFIGFLSCENVTLESTTAYDMIGLYNTNNSIVRNSNSSFKNVGFTSQYSSNNQFINNTAERNREGGFIIWYYAHNNSFVNNTLLNTENGISFTYSNDAVVTGNNITIDVKSYSILPSFRGIVFYSSNNSLVQNNYIKTSVDNSLSYAITLFGASTRNVFRNNLISATYANTPDINFTGLGINNFTNCTFNKSDTYVSLTGKINVFWYADAYVNDSGGSPVESANVSIKDVNSVLQNWSLTSSSGYTPRVTLREYMQNATSKYFDTNYTFNASKATYNDALVQVNLTNNAIDGNLGKVVLTLSSANNPPVVESITTIPGQSITETGETNVTFFANISDPNGLTNLDTINATFNLTGQAIRENATCVNITAFNSTLGNYSCTVRIWYWDAGGDWNVTVNAKDAEGNTASKVDTFVLGSTSAFVINPSTINWGTIAPGSTNKLPNTFILMNNTGNTNISAGGVQVRAYDLLGVPPNDNYFIPAANFSVSAFSGTDGCNTTATVMVNASYIAITGSVLNIGNNTDDKGQANLYYCIREVPSNIISQAYSTSGLGAWTIKIIALAVMILPARRRKKKPLTKEVDEELSELTDLPQDKLELLETMMKIEKLKELREAQEISTEDILEAIKLKKEGIPLSIFDSNLAPSESLIKYLKENLKLTYHEIAEILNRDDRTVWATYKNASKKLKERMEIKSKGVSIPVSIFANRKLSILESMVNYLINKGFSYKEISDLVGKDQRNIWTIGSRVKKKLGYKG